MRVYPRGGLLFCTLLLFLLSGCATLDISPRNALPPSAEKITTSIALQPSGERVRGVLADPPAPLLPALESAYSRVVLLPSGTLFQSAEQIRKEHNVDYILTLGVQDFSLNGSLNPIWFASLPLLFFKPYVPIVTFEATVTLESTLRDAASGEIVAKKQMTSVVTDHFSPKNPQENVQELIGRGVNNGLIDLFADLKQQLQTRQKKLN